MAKNGIRDCRANAESKCILDAMKAMMRKSYLTDLTNEEWSVLEPILRCALYGDKSRTRGHPRPYPLREIVNAMMYILKTGYQWRQLPHDLPP